MSALNRSVVEQMNALPGTSYPPEMGGRVETPRGVLFTGDTTDNGRLDEFAEFEAVYGHDGRASLLKFPVFVAIGNHDVSVLSPVKDKVAERYGGVDYAWDWDDLRLLCLDMYPDARTREWLAASQRAGRTRPVILFFHYSLEGPTAISGRTREGRLRANPEGYNVLPSSTATPRGHYRRGFRLLPGRPATPHFFLAAGGPAPSEVAAGTDERLHPT
jgi:hypothetical protein